MAVVIAGPVSAPALAGGILTGGSIGGLIQEPDNKRHQLGLFLGTTLLGVSYIHETMKSTNVVVQTSGLAEKATWAANAGEELGAFSEPSSKVLRQNLIDAGIKVPDYSNAAHHIVAGNSPQAEEARAILQKYGVDINDAANGIFLPTVKDVSQSAYHPSLHTNEYYEKVNELLLEATSREDVLIILDDIREQLVDGTFMN